MKPTLDVLQRAQGCLVGQLSGDALGSMVEFRSGAEIARRFPAGLRQIGPSPVWGTIAGQPTDDSELALALARTVLETGGFDEDRVAAAYGRWRQSEPFDIGGTTCVATGAISLALDRGESPARAASMAASTASQSNGALMRQSPLAIWGHALDSDELDRYVRTDTRLTHPNPVCQDASASFVTAVGVTIAEGLNGREAYARACEWQRRKGSSASVALALAAAQHAPPSYESNQGWVLIALQNAFYQALHATNLEEGMVATVMGGGDTDTNAAIAGALLGAIYGVNAIPRQWKESVLNCRPQTGAPGVHRPRPCEYWPVDALAIAEALLQLGGHTTKDATDR